MKKEIGVGVIGLGMGVCLFDLNKDDDTRLSVRGVCSARDEKNAREFLDKYDIDFYTNSYQELINRKDIDVIGIFSPDIMHFEHAKAAVEAGKHVVLTKPFTNAVEEAVELAKVVKKEGIKFLVGQTMRFEPQFKALADMCGEGNDFGRVILAESHYIHDMRELYRKTPWRLDKKWMTGAGNHPLDALRWILGDIDEIHAYGSRGGISEYTDYDNFIINLKFKNGALGRILLLMGCVESPEEMMKLSIYGSRGSGFSTHTDNMGGVLEYVLDRIERKPVGRMEFKPELGIDPYGHTDTVLRFMKYFEKCIVSNIEPSPNATDGAKSIIAAAATYRSINEGRPIKINNDFL